MSHMTTKAAPKPRKGSARAMQRARRRLVETRERAAKDAAKRRDSWCCRRCKAMLRCPSGFFGDVAAWVEAGVGRAEAAHIVNKGMGGDHGRRSHSPADYVTLCRDCHQGPRSVHSGHVRIVAGPKGGDGLVRFVDVKTPGAAA